MIDIESKTDYGEDQIGYESREPGSIEIVEPIDSQMCRKFKENLRCGEWRE